MRTLDRYVIREVLAPFALALLVLTFILIIPFIIAQAETMIAKGVPWLTVARVMVTLLPQALGPDHPDVAARRAARRARPALGRPRGGGDAGLRHQPAAAAAAGAACWRVVAWAATSWVMLWAIPDANQTFREITTRLVADRAEGEVKPRVFFEDFPGFVVYVRDVPAAGGWTGVLAADTRNPEHPVLFLAKHGPDARRSRAAHHPDGAHRRHAPQHVGARARRLRGGDASPRSIVPLDPESVFPRTGPGRAANAR